MTGVKTRGQQRTAVLAWLQGGCHTKHVGYHNSTNSQAAMGCLPVPQPTGLLPAHPLSSPPHLLRDFPVLRNAQLPRHTDHPACPLSVPTPPSSHVHLPRDSQYFLLKCLAARFSGCIVLRPSRRAMTSSSGSSLCTMDVCRQQQGSSSKAAAA